MGIGVCGLFTSPTLVPPRVHHFASWTQPPGNPKCTLSTTRPPLGIEQLVAQIKETADKLVRDHASRGDVKLLATALKELRYAFKVFTPFWRTPDFCGSSWVRP